MGFAFRYESLLSYRGHLKEMAEEDLARATRQLKVGRSLLKDHRAAFQEGGQFLKSRIAKRIPSAEIKNHADFMTGLKEKIRILEMKVVEWEGTVRRKREALVKRTKEYKVIEKLKEEDFQRWQYQQLQMEQKRMNEVAVTRHGRVFL